VGLDLRFIRIAGSIFLCALLVASFVAAPKAAQRGQMEQQRPTGGTSGLDSHHSDTRHAMFAALKAVACQYRYSSLIESIEGMVQDKKPIVGNLGSPPRQMASRRLLRPLRHQAKQCQFSAMTFSSAQNMPPSAT
jgi:hypothetical protein